MSFDGAANNLQKIAVVSHTASSGSIVLGISGSAFPAPPFRLTLITGASYGTPGSESLTIFGVSAVATNTPGAGQCTLTVSVIEGTADQNYGSSDFAEMRLTAATISDLNSATATLQTSVSALQAAAVTAVSVTAAHGVSGSSSGGTTPALSFTLGAITPSSIIVEAGAATGIYSLNAANLPASQTGTVLQLGNADATASRLEIDGFGATSYVSLVRADGTAASPTTLQSGDEIGGFNGWGYNGSAVVGPRAAIRLFAGQNWTTGAQGTYVDIAATANGATAEAQIVQFSGSGAILVPGTVTGGDKGAGTINAAGLYVNGVAVAAVAGSSGQIQYNNSSAFGGAANLTVGASGQLNFGSIAAPGSPNAGDKWYDSTQKCPTVYDGVIGYLARMIYNQVANVTVTATGSNSAVSTSGAIGTVSLPAGYLNEIGRMVRITVLGYATTAGASAGNIFFFVKLGSNVVATSSSGTPLTGSRTNNPFSVQCVITTKATGSSGKLDVGGGTLSTGTGSSLLWANNNTPFLTNGTVAGTQAASTQVTLDLTAAYVLDFQVNMSAVSSTNTFVFTGITVEVLG
jgi:hypothetical protein